MDAGPEVNPPPAGTAREALEDLVYRSNLGEAAIRRASPWLTVPVTLALAGVLGALAFVLGRQTGGAEQVVRSVDVVLQEAPEAPGRPAPAPAPAAAPARTAAAPAPVVAPKAPAPDLAREAVPEATPRELPKEDQSRQSGGASGPGSGTGGGAGGVPGGTGAPGAVGAGGGTGRIVELETSMVRFKFTPPLPPYPPLARAARIEGSVLVQIIVGANGLPSSAHALEGPYQLRAAAEAHAMNYRFDPHIENGVPIATRVNLTIIYRIK